MHPDEAARAARELLRHQRFRDAQRICQEALGPAPRSAELHELAGRAWLGLGEVARGIDSLRQALRIDAGVPATWCTLAEALMQTDQPAEATATIASGLDRFPHDPDLQALLALRLMASGQAEDALQTAEVALGTDPDCLSAHRAAAGAAIALQVPDRAEHHCRRALELDPLDIGARRRLALIEHARGNAETAIGVLEEALSIEPAHPQVLDELADHYRRAGRDADAAACWERLAELYPDATDVLLASGHGLAATGRTDAALPHLARAARDPAADPTVWLELSACLDREHRTGQALTACERYLTLRPDDAEALTRHERLTTRLDTHDADSCG